MMDKNDISRYFSENAADWLSDAYDQGDYNYPVGLHRTRLVTEILDGLFDSQGLNLIDIGCCQDIRDVIHNPLHLLR